MIEQTLESLGLTPKEIKTYLALLAMGSASASTLSHRAKLPRSTTHFICHQLQKKGLINVVEKDNSHIFTPDSPDKLLYLVEQEEKSLKEKKDQINRILGTLKGMINPLSVLPKVQFFQGDDGVKKVLNDTLTSQTDLLTFSDVSGYRKYFKRYNETHYAPERIKRRLHEKVIIPDNDRALRHMSEYEANEFTEIVFVDHTLFPFASEINIYDNKAAIVTFSESGHVGIIIENREIYETLRSIFLMTWEFGKLKYPNILQDFLKTSEKKYPKKPK